MQSAAVVYLVTFPVLTFTLLPLGGDVSERRIDRISVLTEIEQKLERDQQEVRECACATSNHQPGKDVDRLKRVVETLVLQNMAPLDIIQQVLGTIKELESSTDARSFVRREGRRRGRGRNRKQTDQDTSLPHVAPCSDNTSLVVRLLQKYASQKRQGPRNDWDATFTQPNDVMPPLFPVESPAEPEAPLLMEELSVLEEMKGRRLPVLIQALSERSHEGENPEPLDYTSGDSYPPPLPNMDRRPMGRPPAGSGGFPSFPGQAPARFPGVEEPQRGLGNPFEERQPLVEEEEDMMTSYVSDPALLPPNSQYTPRLAFRPPNGVEISVVTLSGGGAYTTQIPLSPMMSVHDALYEAAIRYEGEYHHGANPFEFSLAANEESGCYVIAMMAGIRATEHSYWTITISDKHGKVKWVNTCLPNPTQLLPHNDDQILCDYGRHHVELVEEPLARIPQRTHHAGIFTYTSSTFDATSLDSGWKGAMGGHSASSSTHSDSHLFSGALSPHHLSTLLELLLFCMSVLTMSVIH